MVKEQFLSKYGKELSKFVHEHVPKDSSELVAHVSLYLEARGMSTINTTNQEVSTSQSISQVVSIAVS